MKEEFENIIYNSLINSVYIHLENNKENQCVIDFKEFLKGVKQSWSIPENMCGYVGLDKENDYKMNGAFTLIFHKNLYVTNIIIPDITYLIKRNCYSVLDGRRVDPIIMDNSRFDVFITELLSDFVEYNVSYTEDKIYEKCRKFAKDITEEVYDVLSKIIIVDIMHCSALVCVPLSLKVDFLNVILKSGYIAFFGANIYIRNSDKTDIDDIRYKISSYLKKYIEIQKINDEKYDKKISLIPYTRERFPVSASVYSERNGLDGLKIPGEKFFIEGLTVREALYKMIDEDEEGVLRNHLHISMENKEDGIHERLEKEISFWMVQDYETKYIKEKDVYLQGDKSYIIIYAQYLINLNPAHILKEFKPGWVRPNTIPHTLAGSMVQVALSSWFFLNGDKRPPKILDPFCGTGTFLLEAAYRSPSSTIIGSDINPLSYILSKINYEFLLHPDVNKAKILQSSLDGLSEQERDRTNKFIKKMQDEEEFINYIAENENRLIEDYSLLIRVFAYWFCFRKMYRNVQENPYIIVDSDCVKRQRKVFDRALPKGAKDFDGIDFKFHSATNIDEYCCKIVKYTKSKGVYPFLDITLKKVKESIKSLDGQGIYIGNCDYNDLPENSADIIVTDPPYNTNVDEEGFDIIKAIEKLVSIVRHGGCLAVCLPSYTKNGKSIKYSQTASFIIRKIMAVCDKYGKKPIKIAESNSVLNAQNHPIFYWRANIGVSRRGLVFLFAPKDEE